VQKVTDAEDKRDVFVNSQDNAAFGVIIRVCRWETAPRQGWVQVPEELSTVPNVIK
jgi:hypothetical protein